MDIIEEQPHDVSIWEQVAEDYQRLMCQRCRNHRAVAVVQSRRLCGTCWVFDGRTS